MFIQSGVLGLKIYHLATLFSGAAKDNLRNRVNPEISVFSLKIGLCMPGSTFLAMECSATEQRSPLKVIFELDGAKCARVATHVTRA
jgi:hypothetical protein